MDGIVPDGVGDDKGPPVLDRHFFGRYADTAVRILHKLHVVSHNLHFIKIFQSFGHSFPPK